MGLNPNKIIYGDRLIVTVRKGKCHQGKKVDGPSWDPSGDIAT